MFNQHKTHFEGLKRSYINERVMKLVTEGRKYNDNKGQCFAGIKTRIRF